MHTTTFQRRLGELDLGMTVLIVGDRWNIQQLSLEAGVRALIITNSAHPQPHVLEMAIKKNIPVFVSPHDTATSVLLARSAVTAARMLYTDFLSLPHDMSLREARIEVAHSSQFAFPVTGESGELVGVLSKSDFLKPIPRQLILVDHNELSQAVPGAEEIPIVEILDHHRIGVAPTQQPILFVNRPLGSTSTLVALSFQQAGIPVPKNIAGILMCGLLSDTLNLTSPTTTDVDRRLMADLARATGVNPTDLATEIFSVGSPLTTLTPAQAINADCKEYNERGLTFSVAQIEEISFSHFEEKRHELVAALEAYRDAKNYFASVLLVTDVNTQNSILLATGSPAFLHLIDFPEDAPNCWRLDGIVSRKKQLLPYLTGLMARVS